MPDRPLDADALGEACTGDREVLANLHFEDDGCLTGLALFYDRRMVVVGGRGYHAGIEEWAIGALAQIVLKTSERTVHNALSKLTSVGYL